MVVELVEVVAQDYDDDYDDDELVVVLLVEAVVVVVHLSDLVSRVRFVFVAFVAVVV